MAYADWRYSKYKQALHEAAIEFTEIRGEASDRKNSADIHLCVDAMDLCYAKEHIGTFVIVSGDSDFSPLVSKLKENGKHVIGLSMKTSPRICWWPTAMNSSSMRIWTGGGDPAAGGSPHSEREAERLPVVV